MSARAVATQYPVPQNDRAVEEMIRRARDHGIKCLNCGAPAHFEGTSFGTRSAVFACSRHCGCRITVEFDL